MMGTKSAPPTSDGAIAAFERRVGHPISSQFREFLLAWNGGQPEPACFQYRNEVGPYTDGNVKAFYGLTDVRHQSLEFQLQLLRDGRRIPPEVIAIGGDDLANVVCLGVAGDAAPWWDNMHLLATTFGDFLASLR